MGCFVPTAKQYVQKNQNGADSDGGIGDVEGRPRIEGLAGEETTIDVEEVGDRAVKNAVGDVAGGAAEEQSEAGGIQGAYAAARNEQPGDDCDDSEGAADEDCAQGRRGQTSEKTESDAGVARVDEIEKMAQDRFREVIRRAGFDPSLRDAVEEDDGHGGPAEA